MSFPKLGEPGSLPSFYGSVYGMVDGYAEVTFYSDPGLENKVGTFTIKADYLEQHGITNKGRIFEIQQGLSGKKIIPRPDLEDNKWSRAAKEIDLSYLDEEE